MITFRKGMIPKGIAVFMNGQGEHPVLKSAGLHHQPARRYAPALEIDCPN